MIYCCLNNVLHGVPSANVHPQVSSTNFSHLDNSDAFSVSHHFCLARNALWIANFLGVGSGGEDMADACGVHTVSEEAEMGA